jgi:tetratricopeptide (TPR) repeat protein
MGNDEVNKLATINRCVFDARHGHISLAFERIGGLAKRYPNDAHVAYSEGILRLDYLGEGVRSRELFERAYAIDHEHLYALTYATRFARDEQEFRKWAGISLEKDPEGEGVKQFSQILQELDSGRSYTDIMFNLSEQYYIAKKYGESAAYMDIALLAPGRMSPDKVVRGHQGRAESLVSLSRDAQLHRESLFETSPAEEQMALKEALTELNNAIADEYGAYKVNLWLRKAALSIIMENYDDAIRSSDRAIELQPFNNPQSYYCKAQALWELRKEHEALDSAQDGLKQSESLGSVADIEAGRAIVKHVSMQRTSLAIADLEQLTPLVLSAAKKLSDEDLAEQHVSIDQIIVNAGEMARNFRDNRNSLRIPMQHMLSLLAPETVFYAVINTDMDTYGRYMDATMDIALDSTGAMKWDAMRVIALSLFASGNGMAMIQMFGTIMANPAISAEMRPRLTVAMQQELRRYNPELYELFDKNIATRDGSNEQRIRDNFLPHNHYPDKATKIPVGIVLSAILKIIITIALIIVLSIIIKAITGL